MNPPYSKIRFNGVSLAGGSNSRFESVYQIWKETSKNDIPVEEDRCGFDIVGDKLIYHIIVLRSGRYLPSAPITIDVQYPILTCFKPASFAGLSWFPKGLHNI